MYVEKEQIQEICGKIADIRWEIELGKISIDTNKLEHIKYQMMDYIKNTTPSPSYFNKFLDEFDDDNLYNCMVQYAFDKVMYNYACLSQVLTEGLIKEMESVNFIPIISQIEKNYIP